MKTAEEFDFSFKSYLSTHGGNLSAGTWLKVHAFIERETAMIEDGRQTIAEAENNMHFYLTLIGI